MVVKSEIKISLNEKTIALPTVFMDGLHFLDSHWQFSGVNINMIKCHAAFLVLELKYSHNVIIKNCIFGNWTFTQVQHVVIKNCSNSIAEGFSASLIFNNSSGLIENITMKDQNFTRIDEGFLIQNYSYINVTKSNFMNNIVSYGLITVWNLSTLYLSDSNMLQNQARDCAGAIYVLNSVVRLTNTHFNDNKAVKAGGAIFSIDKSSLWIAYLTFRNNQIPFEDSGSIEKMSKDGYGGAIHFEKASVVEMRYVNFTSNKADFGGAIHFQLHSKLYAENVYFSQNSVNIGSALNGYRSCNFSCKNCFFYQNIAASNKLYADGAAIVISNDSMINISGFICENHSSLFTSCISVGDSSFILYNSRFAMNTISILSLSNSHFYIANSSFFNNSSPIASGAIYSHNSTLHVSHSFFYHNKAKFGGGFFFTFSSAVVNNCTFFDNSNTAVMLSNTNISFKDSTFESNSSPLLGGALCIDNSSVVNVSNTKLLKSSAANGGAACVMGYSLLMISHRILQLLEQSN